MLDVNDPDKLARVGEELKPEPKMLAKNLSDDALALMLAEFLHPCMRYVAKWGKWFFFDGHVWVEEATLLVIDRARDLLRRLSQSLGLGKKDLAHVMSGRTINSVVGLLRADRRIAATVEQWDRDLMLLNTPGGVVDLRTGTIRPSRPDDYCLKCTTVAPDFKAGCPLWLSFLHVVSDGREDLQVFLQVVCGYMLTGRVDEEAMFFLFGEGRNGKSTFIAAIVNILGNYHEKAAITTFMDAKYEQHPTDIAKLHGARLVTATETEEGRDWAEAKIKEMTGGDKLTGRFMRQDFFDFMPQFKLLISGNHKPGLKSVDEAIMRRFHLVPFTVTIPEEDQDRQLKENLKAEYPAILAWMIQGCLVWQANGLHPPEAVREATAEYMGEEDKFAEWFRECCRKKPGAQTTTARAYESWSYWAKAAGETSWGKQSGLTAKLKKKGFTTGRDSSGNARVINGLEVVLSETERQERESQKRYEQRRYADND